ncbi:protein of unknown function [Agreia sp. COWG]|nr:protein of unknown function [Agreia sp. COWG]
MLRAGEAALGHRPRSGTADYATAQSMCSKTTFVAAAKGRLLRLERSGSGVAPQSGRGPRPGAA